MLNECFVTSLLEIWFDCESVDEIKTLLLPVAATGRVSSGYSPEGPSVHDASLDVRLVLKEQE